MKILAGGGDNAVKIAGHRVPYSLLGAAAAILGAFLIWKFNQGGGLALGAPGSLAAGTLTGTDYTPTFMPPAGSTAGFAGGGSYPTPPAYVSPSFNAPVLSYPNPPSWNPITATVATTVTPTAPPASGPALFGGISLSMFPGKAADDVYAAPAPNLIEAIIARATAAAGTSTPAPAAAPNIFQQIVAAATAAPATPAPVAYWSPGRAADDVYHPPAAAAAIPDTVAAVARGTRFD